jgi:hypothetical protein
LLAAEAQRWAASHDVRSKKLLMTKAKSVFYLAIGYFCCSFPGIVQAQEMVEWRTLRGIHGVYLIVEDEKTGRFNVADGLTGDQLRQDTEAKLRAAKISVIKTQGEWLKAAGTPYLHININYSLTSDRKYSGSLELVLEQEVAMVRDPSIKLQTRTWGVRIDEFEIDNLQEVRKELGKLVEQFIEDYRNANKSASISGRPNKALQPDGAIACFSSNLFPSARMLIARRS